MLRIPHCLDNLLTDGSEVVSLRVTRPLSAVSRTIPETRFSQRRIRQCIVFVAAVTVTTIG
jgi:hypothetical protein